MFANTQMTGLNMGFPDVCLTPTPAPTPIPYPNLSMQPMAVPAVYNFFFGGTPAHNMASVVVFSMGDNAGINLGVASGTVMGPTRFLTGAFTVLLRGMPATRMTSLTLQNSTNCPGLTLVPSQFKVMILAP
jgi:hypothetical protein